MTVKVRIFAIFATLFVLLSAVIFTMNLMAANNEKLAESELRHFESSRLADQLRQSSDDLTRMVRTYAITGDKKYERYFYEILAIRDGKAPRPQNYDDTYWDFVTATGERPSSFGPPVALIDLMKRIGLSYEELAKLQEAKKNSDGLTNLEKVAFAAMKGLFADSSGKFTIKRVPDPAFSREILHGKEYHEAKAEIMRPIREFMKLLDQRTRQDVETIRAEGVFFRNIVSALVISIIFFSVFAFFHIRQRVINPIASLSTIAGRIEKGELSERASVSSSDEIGILNSAFNSMIDQIQEAINNLKLENVERRRTEEELRTLTRTLEQHSAELEAVVQELEAFCYSVSHDLRAPLRSMDGFSQILLEDYGGKLDAEGRDYLQRVRAASQKMAQLIDDLLKLSRVTRGEHERREVDLSKLAQAVAAELRQVTPERQVTFDIAPGVTAEGDARMIRIALENLLDNAWKFTAKHDHATIEFGVAN
ncbi:MAG: histidine kinase dimerization/phospho-acceptor domain-containing protein, partial [Rhodospirillales bacterium]